MTDVVNGASGADQKASGSTGDSADVANDSSKDFVSLETHRRLLAQKKQRDDELKARDEKIALLERKEKEREEADLKAKEDYKKLHEIGKQELEEYKAKYNGLNSEIQEQVKFSTLLQSLPGALDKKYWRMVDTSEIIIDPSTNEPDPTSIKKVAEKFQAEFGELIQMPGKAKLPNSAASSSSVAINDEVWNSLSAKDKKEKLPDYMAYQRSKIGKN